MIGPHVSRQPTPDDQRLEAKNNEWTAIQSHWGNPQSLRLAEDGYGLAKSNPQPGDPFWFLHSAYCAHATPEPSVAKATADYLKRMLTHCRRAGGHGVVVHVGATKGVQPVAVVDKIHNFLLHHEFEQFFHQLQRPGELPIYLLLENVAAKYDFNRDLSHLGIAVAQHHQVGWCLDLAHAWAAGVPYDELSGIIERHPPRLCHCNYPGSKFGCGLDRHGWRYNRAQSDPIAGMTDADTEAWDNIVRQLDRQNTILICEGSDKPGSRSDEVKFVKTLLQSN